MSAVWKAARAAVRRRRLQTTVVGVVAGLCTAMIVVALGLLVASSAPFDQAYAKQKGAHLVAAFDPSVVTAAQLTDAAKRPEVEAVAGPFPQASVDIEPDPQVPPLTLTVVGRADPAGPVDKLNLWEGRWATAAGEIVLNQLRNSPTFVTGIGDKIKVKDGPALTVVGFAYSVSRSADAWVAPAQIGALHPSSLEMLYRFVGGTVSMAALPSTGLEGSQSYLTLREAAAAEASTFVTFLIVFGILGLAVAVLIVANVVSGAVVAGFRHIGVLKALGFTPGQVMAVYLTMVSVPAVIGCVFGIGLGNLLARPLLTDAFSNFGASSVGVAPWVDVLTLVGLPLVVALSALVPALRARRLPAAEAISAGSAQHAGRGLRVQRWLSGTRLPRAVSLGLGLPFARPGRSALTMAAVVLGVTSMTFAIGLSDSLTKYQNAAERAGAMQLEVHGENISIDAVRALPGTRRAAATAWIQVRQIGTTESTELRPYQGGNLGYQMLIGHWPATAGEAVVSKRFLLRRGLSVGDPITVELDGQRIPLRIVGEVLQNSGEEIYVDSRTVPDFRPDTVEVQLAPGTTVPSYIAAAQKAGFQAEPNADISSFVVIVVFTVSLLTLMLGVVAALGVFNTAVLNARERRRDLGMLKSIGMTPRQVTVMVVTSMALLGAVGGLLGIPIGVLTHGVVVPAMARAAQVDFPAVILHVYSLPLLALLGVAGIVIAALGAFIPARSASRTTIAEVLHNE
jgi:putative ABC transport system permease protein